MSRKRDYHRPLGVDFNEVLETIAKKSKPKAQKSKTKKKKGVEKVIHRFTSLHRSVE